MLCGLAFRWHFVSIVALCISMSVSFEVAAQHAGALYCQCRYDIPVRIRTAGISAFLLSFYALDATHCKRLGIRQRLHRVLRDYLFL
jgi:hypothetical protein